MTKIISPSGLGAKRGKGTPRGEEREQRGERRREREDEKETFCTVQRPSTEEEDAAAAVSQDN